MYDEQQGYGQQGHGHPGHGPQGGRYVVYAYCVSLIIITFKRDSKPIFVAEGESAVAKGMPYTLLTLALGWWGIPFGPIFSLWALYINLIQGGQDA